MRLPIVNNLVYKRKASPRALPADVPGLAGGLRTAMVMMGGPSTPVCACVVDPLVQEWLD